MGEKELWAVFKKWGDAREVFIARNRNRNGRRYGFVRLKGVENAETRETAGQSISGRFETTCKLTEA